jgi:hypothetical protein
VAAREDFAGRKVEVEYRNVARDRAALAAMLTHSGGRREVPVIVEGAKVTIGFGGS